MSSSDLTFSDRLADQKRRSVGQLAIQAGRRFDELAVRRLRSLGVGELRTAHTRLLPHIDLDGTRPTEIARRLGVTKQAVAPLLRDLAAWGVIEAAPDPVDGRAHVVRFTALGREALLHGLSILGALEAEIGAMVGADVLERLGDDLAAVVDALTRLEEAERVRDGDAG